MWNPGGSLIACRCFLIASAWGPVCGIVGMFGDAPVVGIGGISTDGSGFGVGRLLDTEIIRERVLAVHRGGAEATLPPLPDNERALW